MAYAKILGDTSTIGQTLYSALYGGLNPATADPNYIWKYFSSPQGVGEAVGLVKAKDQGFAFGWGNGAIWPAVRLGSLVGAIPGGVVRSGTVSSGVRP